jgi:hypothetical protein
VIRSALIRDEMLGQLDADLAEAATEQPEEQERPALDESRRADWRT